MTLTKPQQDKVLAHLTASGLTNRTCSVCGSREWSVEDTSALSSFEPGNLRLGPGFFPVLPVLCSKCYQVVFFALAPILGMAEILPKESPDESPVVPDEVIAPTPPKDPHGG